MTTETPRSVQLRQDLQHSRQQHQGKSYLVVKDPVARRYFRFTEAQATILDYLANPTDPETIAAQVSEKMGTKVSAATIAAFCDSLESKNLLDTPAVQDRLGPTTNASKRAQSSIFYRQVASFDPERIFNWLLPRTRWAFTPAFQIFGCLLIACGVTIFFSHWSELKAATPNLLNIWTILMVWPIVFSVSAYHEFSHGLTCRHFGGQVKEVGFMLIYFSPAFYCDVSDAWMFPNRRHRMSVTLAGGYSQLMLWGLCAIIWRITEPDTIINHIMLIVVLFSGLQTLFNFNPLIKLDGYYMLSDYLEVPNLRSKAFSTLWKWLTRDSRRGKFREVRAQLLYGVCALVFSTTLLLGVYTSIFAWATRNWATAGLVGFAAFSTITLRRTATESMAGLKSLASYAAVRRFRNISIVVLALIISYFGKWELKIPANFKIVAQEDYIVRAKTAGLITEVFTHEGERVHKGDILAKTRDYDKESNAKQLSGELQQKQTLLQRLLAGALPDEIREQENRVAAKKTELENARKNQQEKTRREELLEQRRSELKTLRQRADNNKELFDKGIYARAIWDEARNAVEVKEHEIAEAEASIKTLGESADREADLRSSELQVLESSLAILMRGSRPEDIKQTREDIENLRSQLAALTEEISLSEIRSPIDGTVATPRLEQKKNQRLAIGEELLRLVNTAAVKAEMLVPEKELEDVKPGSVIWLKARALPDRDFQGRVDFIAPVSETVDGQQMVIVRALQLPNEDGSLRPDMTGVARIYCGPRRIIDLLTRRAQRWVKTEFLHLLP